MLRGGTVSRLLSRLSTAALAAHVCIQTAAAQTGSQAAAPAAPATAEFLPITDERLRNPEPGDWLSYRRTDDVTAFSPLTDINRRTVAGLSVVWSYAMSDYSRWVATPIVANGFMYVSEGSGRVVALNAVTGELVWSATRTFPDDIAASEAYPRHRGVSIHGDTIYWGTADSYVVALDARTGEKRWETQTADYRDGEGHAHPPLIADGKVFIGTTGGDAIAISGQRAVPVTALAARFEGWFPAYMAGDSARA